MKRLLLFAVLLALLAGCEKDNTTTSDPTPTPTPTPVVPEGEKCKASDYKTVKIGTQTWMAENYRCSKYDTESNAYNGDWLNDHRLTSSATMTGAPYYTNATDKSKWNNDSKTVYGVNLSDDQVDNLGYLYSWAAAVGVKNGYTSGKRSLPYQGICPNGWHVPTKDELQTLYDYIYKAQGLTSNQVGKYLKTTSGWYNDGNGKDTYGFAALPAGSAEDGVVRNVGYNIGLWTNTPDEIESSIACSFGINCNYDYFSTFAASSKDDLKSVRCLKD